MILESTILVECDKCGEEEEVVFPDLPTETALRSYLESEHEWQFRPSHHGAGTDWLCPECTAEVGSEGDE